MSPTSCFWTKPASPPICRRYGRAPRGARVHDHAPCGRWQTSTFLAALRVTGLTAPGVFDGAIWRELPRLHRTDPGADPAARRHRSVTISGPTRSPASNAPSRPPGPPSGRATLQPGPQSHRALLREAQSPRSHRSLSQHRDGPFLECLAHFSPDECRNYFRHCGYSAAARS